MTTRLEDEMDEPGSGPDGDDPLLVVLRPGADFLGPPPGRYEAIRRAASRRRLLRAVAGAAATAAAAALIALPLRWAVPTEPTRPAPPLAPAPADPTPQASPSPAPPSDATRAPGSGPAPPTEAPAPSAATPSPSEPTTEPSDPPVRQGPSSAPGAVVVPTPAAPDHAAHSGSAAFERLPSAPLFRVEV
ncbi:MULTISPECIES: hypothetical protein [unclassified Streptomyces]|uniref:hypothetical protein n=1 Tax=unclassified Streptomyces TaxID=2593676 RepID=UPI0037F894A5